MAEILTTKRRQNVVVPSHMATAGNPQALPL